MRLAISRSKNAVSFYVTESFRTAKGTVTSRVVEKLGTEKEIKEKYGQDCDAEKWCRDYVRKLNEDIKANKPLPVQLSLVPDVPLEAYDKRAFNCGYLLLQKELYSLGFKRIAQEIAERHHFKFDLEKILADLVYSRILEPCSKRSSCAFCKDKLIEQPDYELHDVYRALDCIAEESDFIQSSLYKGTAGNPGRDLSVLYYDCTNFYFEIGDEDEFRKYGISKENRPNPIVQMGMFIDGSGIPLGFDIFPGNRNEQLTLKPIEKKILRDFGIENASLIVCTDAGLASTDNKVFNAVSHVTDNPESQLKTDFITILPLKKMKGKELAWATARGRSLISDPIRPDENPDKVMSELSGDGWREDGSDRYISLDDIDESDPDNYNKVFYKEKVIIRKAPASSESKGLAIEERVIVTYSIKYKHFMERKRANDIARARRLIARKNKNLEVSSKSELRRLIKTVPVDEKGEKAEGVSTRYELDDEVIEKLSAYDGFYAVSTSITKERMPVKKIISVNRGRWEIEESFMLMKSELKARPVFVRLENRIKAHFITCFMALTVFRVLEKKVNAALPRLATAFEIIKALREMLIVKIGKYYTAGFTRTDLTDALFKNSGFRLDCELLTDKRLKTSIRMSKK